MKAAAALAALLCLCAAAPAQTPADAGAPFSPTPYRDGERLTYTVSFSNFPTAAHVELLVAGRGQFYGREGVELRAHVETIGVVSAALYALNNNYTTFVDPLTGAPYRSLQNIREGARARDLTREFDQPAGAPPASPKQQVLGLGTFDFLSVLYRLRALPLAQGATYRISVQNGDTLYDAEVKVTGRELVKTNVGSSNALVAQVRVRGNEAADDYRVRVYFADDERHVPVLITARHRAGEIRAELASVEILTETGLTPGGQAAAQTGPGQPGIPVPAPDAARRRRPRRGGAHRAALQAGRAAQLQLLPRRRRAAHRHRLVPGPRPRTLLQPRRLPAGGRRPDRRRRPDPLPRQRPAQLLRRCQDAAALPH